MIDRNRPLVLHRVASSRKFHAWAMLLLCLLASGCVKLAKDWGEISKLHQAIVKEFGEDEVGVNLSNNTMLTVSFVNSPLNDKSPEERAQRAEQTVAFVKAHYASISKLEVIWVLFARAKKRFIFVNNFETIDYYSFDKDGQPLRRPDVGPANQYAGRSTPVARYSESLKQTDVIIEHLQLEGDANFGMSVLVHFTVPGEATELKRSLASPEFVSFDFSSFSEKSMFPGQPKIVALADEKVIFETAQQFSTSKSPDTGQFSEALSLHIPYKAFRRMVVGKKLTLLIGDRAYEFTADQLEALRGMTEYVKD